MLSTIGETAAVCTFVYVTAVPRAGLVLCRSVGIVTVHATVQRHAHMYVIKRQWFSSVLCGGPVWAILGVDETMLFIYVFTRWACLVSFLLCMRRKHAQEASNITNSTRLL